MTNYMIQETFFSLKGEGIFTGVPMYFIRLAGCNLACDFCDTKFNEGNQMDINDILSPIANFPVKRVVITGGEPTMYNLNPLINALHDLKKTVHLETNGMIFNNAQFDWIAMSPKNLFCDPIMVSKADEIKFLVGLDGWKELIEQFFIKFSVKPTAILYVMPITKGLKENQTRTAADFIRENVDDAIEYCELHPEFRYCIQLHKSLGIL